MSSWYFTRHRGEMLISYLRVGVAFLTLFSFRVELALGASQFTSAVYAYGAIASIALVLAARAFPTLQRRIQLQALDLTCSIFFIYIGFASLPLVLSHYVFILSTAMIRFRWPTILWTACLAMIVYLSALLGSGERPTALTASHLFLFALLAIAAMALASYQERLRLQLGAVLDIHSSSVDSLHSLLSDGLKQMALALAVPRIFFVIDAGDGEPRAGSWVGDVLHSDEDAGVWLDFADDSLEHVDFFCNDLNGAVVTTSSGERLSLDEPVALDVAETHQIDSLLLVKFQSSAANGTLVFADRFFDPDDLALGRLASDTFAARLDDFAAASTTSKKLVSAERARVARDLHDGLLQSLTGASLQIETARRLIETKPDDANLLLREIQDILVVDQHELRYLIDALRHSRRRSAAELNSEVRFNAVAAMVRRQWNADVDLRIPSLRQCLTRNDRREVDRLIREAIFNAAKHSGAKLIVAEGEIEPGFVRLTIKDDGHGFPFRGRYSLDELKAMAQGPATLKERVEALGGSLIIDSQERGSVVEMRIPIRQGGAAA